MKGKTQHDRQAVRRELAKLKGVPPGSIPLPRKNAKLTEYRNEIEAIKASKRHEIQSKVDFEKEARRLGDISSGIDYTINFEMRERVQVWNDIIDSNYKAHITVGTPGAHDFIELLQANRNVIQEILQDERQKLGAIKVRIGITANMVRHRDYYIGLTNIEEDHSKDTAYGIYFKIRYMPILPATNIEDTFNMALMRIQDKVDNFQENGLGWVFALTTQMYLEITQYSPPTGSGHIPLPDDLQKRCGTRNGIINPQNTDNECFRWAILCALHTPAKNPGRISQYAKYYNELDFTGIEFPVKADEIIYRRFERQNPNIALCICRWEKGKLDPIYVTDRDLLRKENGDERRMIDLLLVSNGETQHYCYIKNMSRLVAQCTKNHATSYICRWCVSHFTHLQSEHDKHLDMCHGIKKNPQRDRMPNTKKQEHIFQFKN